MKFNSVEEIINFDYKNNLTQTILLDNFTKRFDPETKKVIEPMFRFNTSIKYKGIDTTVGRLIFNKFCLPTVILDSGYYLNEEVTKKSLGEIYNKCVTLKLEGKLSDEDYADFNNRLLWLGNLLTSLSGDSFDSNSFILSPEVKLMLQEFFSSPKEKLQDPEYVNTWQNKIIEEVKRTMGDTGLVKIINAGVKGDFGNNFKNMALFRGIVDGEFITNNLADGNTFDTYTKLGTNAVAGSSARAIKTAQGVIAPLVM